MKTQRGHFVLLAVLMVMVLGMPSLAAASQQEDPAETVLTTVEAGLFAQGSCPATSAVSAQGADSLLPFALQPAAEFKCAQCQPAACALKCCGTCSTVNLCLCICAC